MQQRRTGRVKNLLPVAHAGMLQPLAVGRTKIPRSALVTI